MPISREAFQLRIPGGIGRGPKRAVAAAAKRSEEAIGRMAFLSEDFRGVSNSNAEADDPAEEKTPDMGAPTLPQLPPADVTSAVTQDGIGPNQPKTEARRSVATGRDAPEAPGLLQDSEINESERGQPGAQMQVIEQLVIRQRNAAIEHLGRIDAMLERLMELTEGHLFDGDAKLQSLEQRLAQLEMRHSVNRMSP